MATLAGTTWMFVSPYVQFSTFVATFNSGGSMTAIISDSPYGPGGVTNFTGTWTEGSRFRSFNIEMTSTNLGANNYSVDGGGTHSGGNGSGTLSITLGSQQVPGLQFTMMKDGASPA